MDLALDDDQKALEQALHTLFERHAGPARARTLGDSIDGELLDILDRQGYLDVASESSLVHAVLLVEAAEGAFARAPVAARAIVAPLLLDDTLARAVGLVAAPNALVRYAGLCDVYLFLDHDEVYLATAGQVSVEPVASRWGYPLGRVRADERTKVGAGKGALLSHAWQVALAAEMGAQMTRAITLTSRYVTDRKQFGRPIGSYQAVSHQLATATVYAEGTRWLARRAAWDINAPVLAAVAATYACEAARVVIDATHQVTGAIGIATEYDLVLSTMRLGFLETELGGKSAHARLAARENWPA